MREPAPPMRPRCKPAAARRGPSKPGAFALLSLAAMLAVAIAASGCASNGDARGRDGADETADDGTRHPIERPADPEEAERQRVARRALQDARAYLIQERPEAALRATTRGLLALPDDPALLRERARALDALGRSEEATEARKRADHLDPPAGRLPDGPLPGSFEDLLVVLQAPEFDFGSERAIHQATAALDLEPKLRARLELRLPGVLIVTEHPAAHESVPAARAWLQAHQRPRIAGMRVVRAFCGESVKDGRYAVATLHRTQPATGDGGRVELQDGPVRWSGEQPGSSPDGCAAAAMYRVLERWLTDPFFEASAEAGADEAGADDVGANRAGAAEATASKSVALPRETMLALLPGFAARVQTEHVSARRALFVGDLERARLAYERAARLDPEDADVAAHLDEIQVTLTLNRELERVEAANARRHRTTEQTQKSEANRAPRDWLPAEMTPAQQMALETQLEAERRRRDDLLATLATVSSDRRSAHVPSAALRETELHDFDSKGARRALAQLETAGAARPEQAPPSPVDLLSVRALHAPSGGLVARYYFEAAAASRSTDETQPVAPVLIEEDVSGDGEPDRWSAYRMGLRTEVWEERRSESLPDIHGYYAENGSTLARLELDDAYDGDPDRVYRYEAGVLIEAAHDTNGDGQLDRWDHFDADGRVARREEDLDADGRIDVRSSFREGRLVKREIMEPEHLGAPR